MPSGFRSNAGQEWLGRVTAGSAMQKAADRKRANLAEATLKLEGSEHDGEMTHSHIGLKGVEAVRARSASTSSSSSTYSTLLGFVGSWLQ